MKRLSLRALPVALFAACAATLLAGTGAVHAQAPYPSRAIRLVVPYAAGGATDIVARKYADRMGRLLGQSMLVENKPGAEAAIGAAEVARAQPDGYSVLFGTSSTHIITPALMKNPGYDPVRDFAQIGVLGGQSLAIVVNNDVAAKTLPELINAIKASPGKYSYASSASIGKVAAEMFLRSAGNLNVLEVPYKGAGAAVQDFLANQVQIYPAAPASVLSLYKAGRVRILAVFAARRLKLMPEVPTMAEFGLHDMILATFNVVAVPAKTPQPVIDILARHTTTLAGDEGMLADMEAIGVEPFMEAGPARANAFIDDYRKRLAPVLRGM